MEEKKTINATSYISYERTSPIRPHIVCMCVRILQINDNQLAFELSIEQFYLVLRRNMFSFAALLVEIGLSGEIKKSRQMIFIWNLFLRPVTISSIPAE